MRFDVVFLVAVAASLGHLQSSSGVAGLLMTHADGPSTLNNNQHAVPANGSPNTLDAKTDEERGFPPVGHSIEQVKASMGLSHIPKSENFYHPSGPNAWIEHNPTADLLRHRHVEWGESIQLYETKNGVDNLAVMLVMLLESPDEATSQRADELMQILLQRWWLEGKSGDNLFETLKLPDRKHVSFGEVEYRKIKALSLYIGHLNDWTTTQYSLIQTLMNHYDSATLSAALIKSKGILGGHCADYAKELHQQMAAIWRKKRLSGVEVFAYLGLDKEKEKLFESYEFEILEQHVAQLKGNDKLSGLTTAFGGEGVFAKRAVIDYTMCTSLKARDYLFELLVRLKKTEGIPPADLLKRMFPSSGDKDLWDTFVQALYGDIYKNEAFPGPKRFT